MIENINPKDWYNVKFLDYIPPHFVKLKFKHAEEQAAVLKWAETNLSGRFAIAHQSDPHNTEKEVPAYFSRFSEDHYIAFEDPAEATMYAMFYS